VIPVTNISWHSRLFCVRVEQICFLNSWYYQQLVSSITGDSVRKSVQQVQKAGQFAENYHRDGQFYSSDLPVHTGSSGCFVRGL
jgi:hypothetical protein